MWKSSRLIKKGQQIFSNYGYYKDINKTPDWFKNEWEEFKKIADEISIKVHKERFEHYEISKSEL